MLWNEQSLGDSSPRVLSQTMWWILTQYFDMRQEHHSMEFEAFSFCVDDSGTEYVTFNPLRPNSDLKQTSHCNIKGLSLSEVMRIKNMITQVKFY